MQVVQICTVPYDFEELLERVAALRPPGVVRSEISGNDVRPDWIEVRVNCGLAEVLSPGQVNGRVDFRFLAEVGVAARGVIQVGDAPPVWHPFESGTAFTSQLPNPT